MNLLGSMPPEMRQLLRERAEADLEDIQSTIKNIVAEASQREGFDAHMSLMAALMMKFMDDPITLAMMFTESIYMLAEKEKEDAA